MNEQQQQRTDEQPLPTDEQPLPTDEQLPPTDELPPIDEQQPSTDEQPPSTDEQQLVMNEQQPVTDEQRQVIDEQQQSIDVLPIFNLPEGQDPADQRNPPADDFDKDEDGNGDEDGDGEESDDEEEEEEPKLRYQRVGADVSDVLKRDNASVMAVSSRFLTELNLSSPSARAQALGTHNGTVYILDFEGNITKSFSNHSATVNDISIDDAGEFVASASDDGKVVINALYTAETVVFNYRRPVKCVALDPGYSRKNTKHVVSGGMAEHLVMNEKGGFSIVICWFGHKDTTLHSGEGPIRALKWRGNFIAWANDVGVKIQDMAVNQRITFIDRPGGSPRADLYRCHLVWQNDVTLLIAWADSVKIALIKQKPTAEQQYNLPNHYVEIVSMFQTEFIVCGISPFNDMFVLLAYLVDDLDEKSTLEDSSEEKRKLAKRPELRIVNAYNEEFSNDVLPVKGYSHCQANDYVLDYLPTEDMFYVVSPKDLVAAKQRDIDDHIQWLLERKRYEKALEAAQEALAWGGSRRYDVGEIGQKYLSWLIEEGQYNKAAENCPNILKYDAQLWEGWVFRFAELKQLQAITPYIPTKQPQLSSTVYEIVLAWFLMNDHQVGLAIDILCIYTTLLKTIKTWPPNLYDIQNIIVAVADALSKDEKNETLMESLAELYTHNNQFDKAIEYNLRLHRPNAFDLIRQHNMFSAIKDKAMLLMESDEYLLRMEHNKNRKAAEMPAVQLLVQNVDSISPNRVVPQLRRNPRFLHTYLDALYEQDLQLGYEFHDLQVFVHSLLRLVLVDLYAEYDYPKLMEFLRRSNFYSLEKAYKILEQRDLVPEMVFIKGRMGDTKGALELIIERLQDVQRFGLAIMQRSLMSPASIDFQAIDFAKETNDDELWEDLLKYSMDKPRESGFEFFGPFITALLENVGADINPVFVIRRIPEGLEIPGLKQSLMKIQKDYNLQRVQVSTRLNLPCDMANRVFRKELLMLKFDCLDDMRCPICQNPVFGEENPRTTILFFCRHIFHEDCFFEGNMPDIPKQFTAATLHAKVNHASFLRSTRTMKCPICQERDEEKNGLIGRKGEKRPGVGLPTRVPSPKTPSIRSFGSGKGGNIKSPIISTGRNYSEDLWET
ncbi:vacuolar protein sorting-associated protein 41 [Endogone sp. FLAS-F59071]|nr:vacuolar protein sorting-associated protein 41 [Endogone sp. FLAS-F59071]|eukprot:RUS21513.1 vacuolar protein sorting-associated protein 41 [Endogone sp. FLAS-F59071]